MHLQQITAQNSNRASFRSLTWVSRLLIVILAGRLWGRLRIWRPSNTLYKDESPRWGGSFDHMLKCSDIGDILNAEGPTIAPLLMLRTAYKAPWTALVSYCNSPVLLQPSTTVCRWNIRLSSPQRRGYSNWPLTVTLSIFCCTRAFWCALYLTRTLESSEVNFYRRPRTRNSRQKESSLVQTHLWWYRNLRAICLGMGHRIRIN